MYCTQCGARMPEGTRFCTACGARMAGTEPAEDGQAPRPVDAAVREQRAAPAAMADIRASDAAGGAAGRSAAPIVAAVVAGAAVLGIGIAAVATAGFGLLTPDAQQQDRTVVRIVADEDADAAADAAAAPEREQGDAAGAGEAQDVASDGAETQRAPSTISVDMSSQHDREIVNTFITNFSEVNEGITAQSHFTREAASDPAVLTEMIVFMERHMNGNANAHVESVGADDPLAAQGYRFRCEATYLCGLLYKYFGVSVAADQLGYERSAGGRGTVSGEWFYYGYGSDARFASQGVANVTSLADRGGNLFDVSFDVYRPSGDLEPAEIRLRVYGWPLEQMLDAVGASPSPIYSGTATIEAYYDDGELAFRLYRLN